MTPAAYGCSSFTMAVQMQTAGAEKKDQKPDEGAPSAAATAETQEAVSSGHLLRPGEAGLLIDDLLSLVSNVSKLFDRSAQVDEAALAGFASYFMSAQDEATAKENEIIDASRSHDDKVRPAPPPLPPPAPRPPPPPPTHRNPMFRAAVGTHRQLPPRARRQVPVPVHGEVRLGQGRRRRRRVCLARARVPVALHEL
jgi:hypothetical protein